MVTSPKKLCPGCHRAIIDYDQRRCAQCATSATPRERKTADPFYSSQAWRNLRAAKLAADPLCQCEDCVRNGATVPADTVDHRIERSDDPSLELSYDNLVSMSRAHHNAKSARERHRRRREGQ